MKKPAKTAAVMLAAAVISFAGFLGIREFAPAVSRRCFPHLMPGTLDRMRREIRDRVPELVSKSDDLEFEGMSIHVSRGPAGIGFSFINRGSRDREHWEYRPFTRAGDRIDVSK